MKINLWFILVVNVKEHVLLDHWRLSVILIPTLSLLVALQAVITTTINRKSWHHDYSWFSVSVLCNETQLHQQTATDHFTVSLHSHNGRHLPAIMAVQGDCQWPLKSGRYFQQSHAPTIFCNWGSLNQPITKGWCQPCPIPHWCPDTTRLDCLAV